jgi:hypothetical protein
MGRGIIPCDASDPGNMQCPRPLLAFTHTSHSAMAESPICNSSKDVEVADFFKLKTELFETIARFVQIQVDAYMLTLHTYCISNKVQAKYDGKWHDITYRSMHFPGSRLPTHFASNAFCSNMSVYHGRSAAERNNTRPPSLSTLFRARICSWAADSVGSNQSIESMSCKTSVVSSGRYSTQS